MTTKVISVTEETSIQQIADLLERHQIERVPVLRDNKDVGIVSRANLVIQPRISRSIGTLDFEYKHDSIAAGAIAIRGAIPELRHLLNLTSKK